MIGKVTRGRRVHGLLYYLYGPGRANEHLDPHVVAGFRHPAALEPPVTSGGRRDFRHLAAVLNAPLDAQRRSGFAQPVWQCSMRTAPGDRVLSDDEWAEVAEELMHRIGIAPRGDEQACRWVAIRHAADHIHVVATLAREDGRWVNIHGDHYKVRSACRAIEQRLGLSVTAVADRTATPRPTRAETEQAERMGWREPPRVRLRRLVSQTSAQADSVEQFLAELGADERVTVRVRYSSRDHGQVTGYAVALHDHTNRAGEPIWFSGGKLAPDLTIPQLRRRYTPPAAHAEQLSAGRLGQRPTDSQWPDELTAAVTEATRLYTHTRDPRVQADLARSTADTLHLAARVLGDPRLEQAAELFGRAARVPHLCTPAPTRYGYALRRAARVQALDAARRRRKDPTVALLHLLAALIDLVQTIADALHQRQRTAQAMAARHAAGHLTAARATLAQSGPTASARPRPGTAAAVAAGDFPTSPRPAARHGQRLKPVFPAHPRPGTPGQARRGRSR